MMLLVSHLSRSGPDPEEEDCNLAGWSHHKIQGNVSRIQGDLSGTDNALGKVSGVLTAAKALLCSATGLSTHSACQEEQA